MPNQQPTAVHSIHVYEVRPRKDHRCVDLISDALPFGRLCYGGPNAISNAIGYAKFYSRSHHAVIRVYDAHGNVIEAHEHAGADLSRAQPALEQMFARAMLISFRCLAFRDFSFENSFSGRSLR